MGTILNAIEVVKKVVAIYNKIQECPEQMQLIGERMERLSSRLAAVKDLVQKQQITKDRTDNILIILKHISDDSKRVEVFFNKWKNDLGPFDLQFRSKHLAQVYFALGSSASELKDLGEKIERYNTELFGELQLLQLLGVNKLQVLVNGGGPVGPGQLPISSSSPVPHHQDFNVIFIDPYNLGRGIVAEAYLKLLREWTLRTGGDWHIKLAHSSGFFIRHYGAHNGMIEGMSYRCPGYKLKMAEGGKPPQPSALAALFDNKMFDHPFKAHTKQQMEARLSRGISRNIFKIYDYILVFTNREHDNLHSLKQALVDRDGKVAIIAEGKGRIIHLGSGGEILDAKSPGGREQWNAKCGEIKTAIKRFLANEMEWKQPLKGAKMLF